MFKGNLMKSRLTHLFTLGALSCTLFGASPETALAKPQMQRMPTEVGQISKSPRTIQNIGDLIVGEPVAYVTDALNYAKIGRARGVTRTAVYATVVITSPTFYSKPGRSSVAYANGILNLVGKTGSEYLVGDLNVIRNGGDLSSPFQGMTFSDLSTRLTIRRDGFVSIRTTIKGRRSSRVETTSFKSNGADGFLWGIDPNNGKPQLISVMLSKSVFPLPGAQPANAPAEPTSAPPAAVPRGMKVKVSGQIRVTNSDDGIAFMGNPDNTVEMFGTVKLNNHDAWNVGREKAGDHIKGDVIPFDGSFATCTLTIPTLKS